VSTDPATTPTLATLRASRAQQEAVARWLRPLGPLVLAVVVWAAFQAHPVPGLGGRHLAVTIVLGAFVLGGLGVLATLRRGGVAHIGFVAVVLVASATLVWLQPDGAGIAGIFVGMALLAPVLRRHLSIPLVVTTLVLLGVVMTAGGHASITSVLLNAAMIGSFYGLLFFAIRLGEANRLAERLLIELEQSRAAQARAAGLAERQRLAREMHDVLAHSLSGLLLQLEGARMLAAEDPSDPRLPQAVNRAHQWGRSGLEEARRAIGMLRDDELPGPERLAGLAAQFQQDHGIPCRLVGSGAARELGSEARLALYRVAQEALTNIAKHARPERVELHLAYEPSATRLTVEDFATPNGCRAAQTGDSGYGLTGMRERAELLGGRLTAGTTPSGFRVELDIPA
jgi:signal transduction histidine kinase